MKSDDTPQVTRESDKFMLRLPDGMRDQIAEAAKRNNRSMNSEIIARLAQTLTTRITVDPSIPVSINVADIDVNHLIDKSVLRAFEALLERGSEVTTKYIGGEPVSPAEVDQPSGAYPSLAKRVPRPLKKKP